MLAGNQLQFLLASHDPALLAAAEPVLAASGIRVNTALSIEAALAAMTAPNSPSLVLLDVNLPGMEPCTSVPQMLAAVYASRKGHGFPIVLISDTVTEEWSNRLTEGVIDDLIQRAVAPMHLRIRLETALRNHSNARELERLREAVAMNAQMDPLTGVYNRATLLSMLFRETDRVQRMKTSLCVMLFDIDDFGHWNSRLGTLACDELLPAVVQRATLMLRTYDVLGRAGKDEFLVILPGCGTADAMMLAERLCTNVFAEPFHVAGQAVRLSACFGIASSDGRSPVVVLRDAEKALQKAKCAGPESILCSGGCSPEDLPTAAFLSPGSGNDFLAW